MKEWIKATDKYPKAGSYIVCRHDFKGYQRMYIAKVLDDGIWELDKYLNPAALRVRPDQLPDELFYCQMPAPL